VRGEGGCCKLLLNTERSLERKMMLAMRTTMMNIRMMKRMTIEASEEEFMVFH